jgi:hypothetical protein
MKQSSESPGRMRDVLNLAIYNRFSMGKQIAAELTPSAEHLRKWIIIFQPDGPSVVTSIPEHNYQVFVFELEKEKIADMGYDHDLIMHNDKRYYLNTEEELIDLLLDLRVNPKSLTYPWRCDYPI